MAVYVDLKVLMKLVDRHQNNDIKNKRRPIFSCFCLIIGIYINDEKKSKKTPNDRGKGNAF